MNYFRKGHLRARLLEIVYFRSHLVLISYATAGIFQILPLVFCVFIFQTGEKLLELHGHSHKITAIASFSSSDASEEKNHFILTASADRTVIVSFDLDRI